MEPSHPSEPSISPTPSCLRSFLIESLPDVRLVARRLRQIQLLCDVTLVFNEDEVEGGNYEDEDDAEEKAAPLHGWPGCWYFVSYNICQLDNILRDR